MRTRTLALFVLSCLWPATPVRAQEPRPAPERTAEHEDPVIQRALALLGEPVNPVRVVTPRDYDSIRLPRALHRSTSASAAFRVWRGQVPDAPIYVNRSRAVYTLAAREHTSRWPDLLLASTLLHEQIHQTEGDEIGEGAALRKQADFIRSRFNALNEADARRGASVYLNVIEQRANEMLKRPTF